MTTPRLSLRFKADFSEKVAGHLSHKSSLIYNVFLIFKLRVSGYLMQYAATNDSLLMTRHLKDHTLFHDTYLYSWHKRVPLSYPPASPDIEVHVYLLNASISLFMRKYGGKSLGLILLLLYRRWPFNLGCSLIYRGFTDHCLLFIL